MSTPAGFYDDGSGRKRYFDGTNWTDKYEDAGTVAPSAAPAAYSTPAYGGTPAYAAATGYAAASAAKPGGNGLWITGLILWIGAPIVAGILTPIIGIAAVDINSAIATGGASAIGGGVGIIVVWIIAGLASLLGLILFIVGLVKRNSGPKQVVVVQSGGYPQ